MYKELNRYDTFEDAVKAVYGRPLDQLSEEFQLAMRRSYYPSVDSLAPLSVLGIQVAKLAVKPAYVPDSVSSDSLGSFVYHSPSTRISRHLPEVARGEEGARDSDRRSLGAARIVSSVRLAHGRLPPWLPPLHRAVR